MQPPKTNEAERRPFRTIELYDLSQTPLILTKFIEKYIGTYYIKLVSLSPFKNIYLFFYEYYEIYLDIAHLFEHIGINMVFS